MTGSPPTQGLYALSTWVFTAPAVLAPLVALRRPILAAVMALSSSLPLILFLDGVQLRLSTFVSLLGVAVSVMLTNSRRGWLFGAFSLVVPAAFCFSPRAYLWTSGVSGGVTSENWDVMSRRIPLLLLYALGTALLLGTVAVLVQNGLRAAAQRELDRRAAAVDARAEMARDLHDVVAHRMSLVAVRAETAPYSHPEMSAETRAVLADIAADARGALAEMRDVLGVLRDENDTAPLRPQPSAADVATLVEEARAAGTRIEVVGELPRADAVTGNTLYRIVQEALTNARRHAPNAPVTVTFTDAPDRVRVVVTNPAPGTGVEAGRGLTGMRERVERTGGRLTVAHGEKLHDTDATGSFVVDATLPRSSS